MSNILLKLKDEKGQSLVEFALVVGLLLAIFFGIVEFGRAWYLADQLKNAANIAARTAAVTKTKTQAEAVAKAVFGTATTGVTVTFSPNLANFTSTVKVTVSKNFVSVVPVMPSLGDSINILGNRPISRDATYRVEK